MERHEEEHGPTLALYPSPLIVVGAMVDGKPTWTPVAHAGTMAHSHLYLQRSFQPGVH